LHSEVSLHVTLRASVVVPWHFAAMVQTREHASSLHSVLQSVPAAHVQAESVQVQPTPKHVGAPLSSPPHPAAPASMIETKANVASFIGLASSGITPAL
jgi:hypothetical protein